MRLWARLAAAGALACLAACGRYSDFELPKPEGARKDLSVRLETRLEPVLGRGAPGAFDSVDALNPSIVRRGDTWFNFYSGFDGKTWHTGLALSGDGVTWQKHGTVISPSGWEGRYIAANGSALWYRGEFYYWYQAGEPFPRVALARSRDGKSWKKVPDAVLELGPRGSWDERAAADPYVIEAGEWLYMFYLGEDRARRQRLGVARSRDGVEWEKLRVSPVMELGDAGAFDENGLGEPAVWQAHGWWWMIYTGRDRAENRRLGAARSRDGVRWERAGVLRSPAGAGGWMSKVVCDPHVEPGPGGAWQVWFGGGDVAHPAENVHGAIGYATLHLVPTDIPARGEEKR